MKTCPKCLVTYKRPLGDTTCGRCRDKARRRALARSPAVGRDCPHCGGPVRANAKYCVACWRNPELRRQLRAEGRESHPVLDDLLAARVEVYRQRAELGLPLFTETP